ncbi:MAG: ATP-dependent RecD-like DNA helicase [Lachnospiraceae bacterium]|nr:ATP-dependent RecD-like DNA helicase [Lachnospiraceae bacterium]MEE0920032.1 ATP-dependent RecD-like DNA helicase [Lachnospiraceae bacterium]
MYSIKGFVEHIIFKNQQNGYGVINLVVQENEITCTGIFNQLDEGECIEAEGEYVDHAVYGKQFKVSSFKIVAPEDAVAVERYLGSGAIKGIGAALAARIVRHFGEDTFRIIEEEPHRLAEIKGISKNKAREIAEQVEEKKDVREAMIFLQKYGISNTLSIKIYKQYGMGLYKIMQENPYKLAEDVSGIGFKIADEIASKIGIHTDSDYRIRSGILYTLMQAGIDGHVYLPQELLLNRAAQILSLKPEQIQAQVSNLAMDKKIVIKEKDLQGEKEKCIYSVPGYYAELNCARMLFELQRAFDGADMLTLTEKHMVEKKISKLETACNMQLDELQRAAVLGAVQNGIFILSGGPGTGKTTTINMIIKYFEEEGLDIFLAAPTGRAAKRMTEATGFEAKTIHRLLELNGGVSDDGDKAAQGAHFERNELNPLETDVIIIDEMSMVDIYLFQSLLKAIVPGTRLIMVGDRNQLPSVGAGQVLNDLMGSGALATVVLSKIFRQAGESDIVVNAHLINEGKSISLNNKSKDFFFLERDNVNVIYKHMILLITEKLPRYVKAGMFDIQVLTPMRKGALGVETLNKILQEYLNPASDKKAEIVHGDGIFRQGDKVMQIKNNYQLEWEIVSKYGIPVDGGQGVFNGDVGIIKEINETAKTLTVEFDDMRRVKYPLSGLDEIELAYAITIHKSQGSEYPAVIMPILSGPKMLFNRNLLYTGVTRAKNCVTILGSSNMLNQMIANENEQKRYTGLKERIFEIMKLAYDE